MILTKILGLSGYRLENHIIGIIFVLAILLPHIGALYLINPLLLAYLISRYTQKSRISIVQKGLAAIIVISTIWCGFSGIELSNKSLIRSAYILMMLLCFPFCGNKRIPTFYIYFVPLVILLSQICYIYEISSVIALIDKIYPYDGEIVSESADYLVQASGEADGSLALLQTIRFGGLFHNSNQCMKYMSLCTIVFVIENFRSSIKSCIPFLFIIILSAILAGSRTGATIILLTLVVGYSLKTGGANLKRNLFFIACGLAAIMIVGTLYLEEYRVFRISEGFDDGGSISIKWANLQYYLNVADNVRPLLVGNASIENIRSLYHTPFTKFDSEWGYAIYFYGFTFLLLYAAFLLQTVFKLRGIYIVSAFMLFWIISSSVLFSYRTSFAFFFLLSKYVSASYQLDR